MLTGFAGIARPGGGEIANERLDAMARAMSHRAPDGADRWREKNVGLVQCRHRGPLARPEGATRSTVFHGPEGAAAKAPTTPEELLTMGEALAFARWDGAARALTLVRDPIGIRPVFYAVDKGALIFATELAVVLAATNRPELERAAISEHLADDFRSVELTPWQGIFRLPPGHALGFNSDGLTVRRYWFPERLPRRSFRDVPQAVAGYKAVLAKAMSRALAGDGAIAAEVSGGLDSSALFALAHRAAPDRVTGYSLSFPDVAEADESDFARAVGQRSGANIVFIPPARPDLDWYLAYSGQTGHPPLPPNTSMQMALHAAARAQGADVIISGLGGDEWLTGGPNGAADFLRGGQMRAFFALLAEEWRMRGALPMLAMAFRRGLAPLAPAGFKRAFYKLRRAAGYRSVSHEPPAHLPPHAFQVGAWCDPMALQSIETMELLAAQSGLELRLPYWDREMVEFALTTSDGWRNRAGRDRALHREACRGLLPNCVLGRQDKAEFSSVFRAPIGQLANDMRWSRSLTLQGWMDATDVAEVAAQANVPTETALPYFRLWGLFSASVLADLSVEGGSLQRHTDGILAHQTGEFLEEEVGAH